MDSADSERTHFDVRELTFLWLHDDVARNLMEETLHALKKKIQKRLETAKKDGAFGREFDAPAVATAITSIFSGFMVLGKANFSRATMRKAVQASLALLKPG